VRTCVRACVCIRDMLCYPHFDECVFFQDTIAPIRLLKNSKDPFEPEPLPNKETHRNPHQREVMLQKNKPEDEENTLLLPGDSPLA
jgi:hypothetical protein